MPGVVGGWLRWLPAICLMGDLGAAKLVALWQIMRGKLWRGGRIGCFRLFPIWYRD